MGLEPLLAHVAPLMLVICRLGGLFIFTPILSNRGIPARFRALMAVMLGVAVYVMVPGAASIPPPADLFELLPLVIGETLIGVVIGFLAGLPVLALDMAGQLMGHQMGLGLARVYNPDMGAETEVLGQVLMYLGIATYLAMGGLEAAYFALVSTFERVPIGGFSMDQTPVQLIVGVVASGFELAVRIAAPVLAIIFMLLIAMGFVMKTMPQINVLSVGFTIKILFGLAMLGASIAAIQTAAGDEIERVLRLAVQWGRTLS